jgi:hypothetical protein
MKDSKLNFRLLLKLMLPIVLLFCIAAYQLAFKKTWKSYQVYKELGDVARGAEDLSISPAYSAAREEGIDALYKRYLVDTLSWKNQLWNQCAILSQRYDCSVQGFPAWRQVAYGSTAMLRQEIVFNGSFHNLLRLQYALDTMRNVGLIAGLSYIKKERDLQTSLKLQLLGLQKGQK